MRTFPGLLLLLCCTSLAYAQSTGLKGWLEKRDQLKEERIAAGEPFLSPMIGPGYTPDAGLLFAIGGLLSFKTNPRDTLIQRSSLPVTFIASTRGNIGFGATLRSFWRQDRIRFNVLAAYNDARDDYFGVGYNSAIAIPQSDTTTRYQRQGWNLSPELLLRLGTKLYGGVMFDFNSTEVLDPNPVMQEDPTFNEFGPQNYNAGLGFMIQYDSRDVVVNAWKGIFANLAVTFYRNFLGSDNEYQIVLLDLRHYRQVDRPGKTIAFRFKGRFGSGDVPYAEMTRLGGGRDLRGYIKGQYRDKAGVLLLAEYRHMFLDEDRNLSPHGFTAWIGTGSVFDREENIRNWLPNLGVGYRFEVQPRMNVRIDFGIGRETSGLYFNFTEAF